MGSFKAQSVGPRSLEMINLGSWNVRGLTELKLFELVLHMEKYSIDILCIQETWVAKSHIYKEYGFTVILSGSWSNGRSWAGVAFIIAPWCNGRVQAHKQISDRLAYIKLRVVGGTVGIITVYAPHNMRELSERFNFYVDLDDVYKKCSGNRGKLV